MEKKDVIVTINDEGEQWRNLPPGYEVVCIDWRKIDQFLSETSKCCILTEESDDGSYLVVLEGEEFWDRTRFSLVNGMSWTFHEWHNMEEFVQSLREFIEKRGGREKADGFYYGYKGRYKRDVIVHYADAQASVTGLPKDFNMVYIDWDWLKELVQCDTRVRIDVDENTIYFTTEAGTELSWTFCEEEMKNSIAEELANTIQGWGMKKKEDGWYYWEE